MRRLSICIVVAVALVVTSAWADWRNLGPTPQVKGLPQDVEIRDAGHFALATDGGPGAYEIVHDPGTGNTTVPRMLSPPSMNEPFMNAYIDPDDNCLGGVTFKGQRTCPPAEPLASILPAPIALNSKVAQVRHTATGSGFLIARYGSSGSGSPYIGYFPTWGSVCQGNITSSDLPVQLSAVRVGTSDVGLIGLNTGSAFVVVDAVVDGGSPTEFNALVGSIEDIQLFAVSPTQAEGLIAGTGGLSNVAVKLPEGTGSAVPNASLAGVKVSGLSYEYATGDADAGTGFGMAVGVAPDGGTVIYSAVPDPDAPAQVWQPNTMSTSAPGTPKRVRCWHGLFCVLYTDAVPTGNVFLYYNLNTPSVSPPAPATIDEGGAPVRIHATVGDSDGDALWVKWTADSPALQVSYPADAGRDTVEVSASQNPAAFCGKGSLPVQLTITASDGVHVNPPARTTVYVNQTSKPGVPQVNLRGAPAPAGGPSAFATASPGSGACPTQGYTWSMDDDAGFTFVPDGGVAEIIPPLNYCNPNPGVGHFSVRADDGALYSDPLAFTVSVDPWGPPGSPLDGGATVTLDAGTSGTYAATDSHVCTGTGGFQGVDNEWDLPSTSIADFFVGGSPVSGNRVTAHALTVAAHECTSGQVTLAVTPYTRNSARIPGPRETLTVDVVNVLVPLASGGISLDGGYGGGTVRGTVSTGLNCAESRGVKARLALSRAADPSNPLDTDDRPLMGSPPTASWDFDVPVTSCAGESFVVSGQLLEGSTPGPVAQLGFTTPALSAGIEDVDVVKAPAAACGDDGVVRASGELRARFAPGQCPAAQLTWEQLGGAPVTGAPLQGSDVAVEAVGSFEALTSQPLHFRVTADAGNGNTSSFEKSVPVTLAHFVEVHHRTDAPLTSESGILGVEVKLENPRACGVTGATYREQLDGLRYVPGTARLDGAPVDAVEQDGELVLSNLELPARGSRTLTYSARPRLLGSPQPRGQAFLNQFSISDPEGLGSVEQQGCGCSGGGAGLSALALALAGLWLRRSARRPGATGRS